ncbi:MAG: hypothetical protein E6I14_01470 [Chloroflexi bacterium]|nr:MAG: hypothetical protein E6I14_01470 [Chloroflexota bacterium]
MAARNGRCALDRRRLLHDPGTAPGAPREPAGGARRHHADPRPEFASGRAQELTRLDTRWSWAILTGIILAVGVYAFTRATIARWAYRLVEIGPRAAGGDTAAAAEMPQLASRIRRFGYVQLLVGALILLAMVTARLS